MNKTLTIIVGVLGGIMVILLAVVLILVLQDVLGSDSEATPTAAVAVVPPEATAIMGATATIVVGQMPATFTPLPTIEATNTPVPVTPDPTETPLPTNTLPPPTATNTAVPIIYPTNTPPPPANTPVPPPPQHDTRGLIANHFALQDRSDFRVNQPVWFEFEIVNTTGQPVPFGSLGVMPRKDGQDRVDWFQNSWGGNDDAIPAEGLSWEDNITLPESGNYTLRLAICFEGYNTCRSGGGTYATLSNEIPVTIN